jgi:maltose phosphorylase
MRASRLELDDYNNDTIDGLHITSMGGAWMSIVMGFAGLRIKNGMICFRPVIPKQWERLSFKINVKGRYFTINITRKKFYIKLESGNEIDIEVSGKKQKISPGKPLEIDI